MPGTETRTLEQRRQHYEVERELADRLRAATKEQRRRLYTEVYDELFKRVPLHPRQSRQAARHPRGEDVREKLPIVRRFLNETTMFLEVGSGDCAFATAVADLVAHVVAIDVSNQILRDDLLPENVQLVQSDGSSIPVEPGSVDVAYSDQLMEHVHPDDAVDQLRHLYAALKRGGVYVCITPNRLSGPHDISGEFDAEATGLHLKEYTVGDLAALFRAVGFTKVRIIFGIRGRFMLLPTFPAVLCEQVLSLLPAGRRRAIAGKAPFRWLLGVQLAGFKD